MVEVWFAGLLTGGVLGVCLGRIDDWKVPPLAIALVSAQLVYFNDGHALSVWVGLAGLCIAGLIAWIAAKMASRP